MTREMTDEPASAGSDKVAILRWTVCAAGDAKPGCVAFRRPTLAACFGALPRALLGFLPEHSKNFDDRRDVV